MPRYTFTCEQCGKEVTKQVSPKDPKPRFCSQECGPHRQNRVEITCQQCGQVFISTPKQERKFCSRKCYWIAKQERIDRVCECCGKEFQTALSGNTRYCSRVCWRAGNVGERNGSWKGGAIQFSCECCGQAFYIERGNSSYQQRDSRKFCSMDCRNKSVYENRRITKCNQCGCEYDNPKNGQFCSWDCWQAHHASRVTRNCDHCGEEYTECTSRAGQYCSQRCHLKAIEMTYVGVACLQCGTEFRVPTHANRRQERKFCTHHCYGKYYSEYYKTHQHPAFVTGEYSDAERKTIAYRRWRSAVLKRDKYQCQKCGTKKGSLHAHHLYEHILYKEIRHLVQNGQTLCERCHSGISRREREYRISLGLPADNPPFRLELFPAWDT